MSGFWGPLQIAAALRTSPSRTCARSSREQMSPVLPRSPRVAQTTPTSTPAAVYLAIVPPAMNVSSSGCAKKKSNPATIHFHRRDLAGSSGFGSNRRRFTRYRYQCFQSSGTILSRDEDASFSCTRASESTTNRPWLVCHARHWRLLPKLMFFRNPDTRSGDQRRPLTTTTVMAAGKQS